MRKLLLIFMLPLFFGASCNPDSNLGYSPPAPVKQANDKPEMCPQACARASYLHCEEAQPLVYESRPCQVNSECKAPDGKLEGSCVKGFCTETCEDTCKAFIAGGRHVGTACWATINNCGEIESKCRL